MLVAVPVCLVSCAVANVEAAGGLTLLVVACAVCLVLANFEASKPALRQIMPTVTLAGLAAAGRILFAPIPDVKPVSAIAIVGGATLGRRCGFMVGALGALVSNFFFGQGAWTPWQMYGWGMVGYVAGLLAQAGLFGPLPGSEGERQAARGERSAAACGDAGRAVAAGHSTGQSQPADDDSRAGCDLAASGSLTEAQPIADPHARAHMAVLMCWGFMSAMMYGLLLNGWYVIAYVRPITWATVIAAYAAGFGLDCVHGVSTMAFLALVWRPWGRAIARVVRKYGLA